MNQAQRKFLVDTIDNAHQQQVNDLESHYPTRPSLNNYLVAAFLDGSIQFNDMADLKKYITNRVLKMGKSDALIHEETKWNRRKYHRNEDEEIENTVHLIAEELFVIPDSYLKALKEYNDATQKITDQIIHLNAVHKTLVTKIQIGSDKALDKLIEQADNLADISLVDSQLKLIVSESKLIENKK